MMLSIIPLDLGSSKYERSFITYRKYMGEKTTLQMLAFYIDGAEKKIMVDTGPLVLNGQKDIIHT